LGRGIVINDFLTDGRTTGYGLDVAALLHLHEQSVVFPFVYVPGSLSGAPASSY
jgi:hypothetical protein